MEVMDKFIQILKKYQGQQIPNISMFYDESFALQDGLMVLKDLDEETKKELCSYIFDNYEDFHELIQIYLDSFLLYQFREEYYTMRLLRLVNDSEFLTMENRMYVYYQMICYGFHMPEIIGKNSRKMLREMYVRIYNSYKEKMNVKQEVVPLSKRNPKAVVFLISQFLNENHGPTKTILDRCYAIAKKRNMQPVIINTAESVNKQGGIPIFGAFMGNYSTALKEYGSISYKDFQFPYFQCSDMMPNIPEMQSILNMVKDINPYCIFHVGGGSFTADICSNYYPLINIATVPSGIATTQGQFQLTGKQITEDDIACVKQYGLSENHLQHCLFTSTVMVQNSKIDRKNSGIPEESFVVLVVGARLDFEVSTDFIEEVLLPIMEQDVFVVFAGGFEKYESITEQYPIFKEHSVYMGFVKDILALNEICDAYANPKRTGGGTSVVEAMIKGLPAVTLPHGDVGLGAGEMFHVQSYAEMTERLLRLRDDREYYAEMSEKALARAAVLTDTESAFLDAFQKIEKLEEFQ